RISQPLPPCRTAAGWISDPTPRSRMQSEGPRQRGPFVLGGRSRSATIRSSLRATGTPIPPHRQPSIEERFVTGLVSTLATIWRLAIPYFRSEDRWAGRLLLGMVIAAELGSVAINVMLNAWNARFFNA